MGRAKTSGRVDDNPESIKKRLWNWQNWRLEGKPHSSITFRKSILKPSSSPSRKSIIPMKKGHTTSKLPSSTLSSCTIEPSTRGPKPSKPNFKVGKRMKFLSSSIIKWKRFGDCWTWSKQPNIITSKKLLSKLEELNSFFDDFLFYSHHFRYFINYSPSIIIILWRILARIALFFKIMLFIFQVN